MIESSGSGYSSLNIENLSDRFVKYFQNNLKLVIPELNNIPVNNEIELSLFNIPISYFTHLYNYKNECKTYFELRVNKGETKYRKRIPFVNIGSYNVNNLQIISKDDNSLWEVKQRNNVENIYVNELKDSGDPSKMDNKKNEIMVGDIKHSYEYKDKIVSNVNMLKKIGIYFVKEINIRTDLCQLTLRHEIFLGISNENEKSILINYFINPNNPNQREVIKTEIEYISDFKNLEFDLIKQKTDYLLKILFGYNYLHNISYLIQNPKSKLKTHTKLQNEVLKMDYTELAITPKIDGLNIIFEYINGVFYIYNNFLKIRVNSNFNVPSKIKNVIVRGNGELIKLKQTKELYPFYISEFIMDDKNMLQDLTRMETLELFFNYVNQIEKPEKSENPADFVNIKPKLIIQGFENIKDYLIGIYDLLEKPYTFDIDGLIIFKPKELNNSPLVDYKLKMDNTVDMLCYVGVSKGILINGNQIEIITYINGNQFEKYESVILNITTDLYFDTNLNSLIWIIGGIKHVIPNHFIGEFSFVDRTIIRPRMEKTNMLYNQTKHRKYGGNSLEVFNMSKLIHQNNLLNIMALKDIKNNPNDFPDNEEILKSLFENVNNDFFYNNKQKNQRTILNLITNFIKTNLISLMMNSLVNTRRMGNVLDVEGGQGGDANKLFYNGAIFVLASDVDNNALSTYVSRHNNLNTRNKAKMFKLEIVNEPFTSKNYIEKVTKIYKKPFDFINIQLAIHFYWNDLEKHKLINNIKYFSRNGTNLSITTNNGNKIAKLLQNKTELKYLVDTENKIYFEIYKVDETRIKVIYQPSTNQDGSIENLVMKEDMIDKFKSNCFRLNDCGNFDLFYDYIDLLETMQKGNKAPSAKKLFTDILNNFEKEKNNKELKELLSLFSFYNFTYILS